MDIILSAFPQLKFSSKILQSPLVKAIRLNTGAKLTDSPFDTLEEFQARISPKVPWVDLKCRELRVVKDAILPESYLEINHPITVNTPTALYYNEGKGYLIVEKVINKTQLQVRKPKNYNGTEHIKFGQGASINIPDASLSVEDYLTEKDNDFIKAAIELNIHNYLLSFVESAQDIEDLLAMDSQAKIIAKIESKKGVEFVQNEFNILPRNIRKRVQLLLARGDLYIELDRPHEILNVSKLIIHSDPTAFAGSRILESFLEPDALPSCADICDIGYLIELGYRSFLLGDDLCMNDVALGSVLGLLTTLDNR